MTDTDKFRDSEMQSLRSAEGMRREIRWVHPAQVWIFLSLYIFGPHYLIYQPIESFQKNGFYVKPYESKSPHSS